MSKESDKQAQIRALREAKVAPSPRTAAPPIATPSKAKAPVTAPKVGATPLDCPVCAKRREAKRKSMAKWRAKK